MCPRFHRLIDSIRAEQDSVKVFSCKFCYLEIFSRTTLIDQAANFAALFWWMHPKLYTEGIVKYQDLSVPQIADHIPVFHDHGKHQCRTVFVKFRHLLCRTAQVRFFHFFHHHSNPCRNQFFPECHRKKTFYQLFFVFTGFYSHLCCSDGRLASEAGANVAVFTGTDSVCRRQDRASGTFCRHAVILTWHIRLHVHASSFSGCK